MESAGFQEFPAEKVGECTVLGVTGGDVGGDCMDSSLLMFGVLVAGRFRGADVAENKED